jgi:uncharacterized protein (TIGR02996 family)
MLDRRTFIDAILEDSDDDTPRLVLADYLEEYGDASDRARADFIRAGCEAANLAAEDLRRVPLERREDELLAEYGAAWASGLPGHPSQWTQRTPHRFQWRRGFPWGARIDACDFLSAIERVLPGEAIFGVELVGRGPESPRDEEDRAPEWLDRLVASPRLKLVGTIDLCDTHFCLDNRPDRFVKLIGSPYLSGLTGLSAFMDYIGLPGVRAVIAAPAPFRLRRLMLGCFIEPEYAEVGGPEDFLESLRLVAGSPRMGSLESFDLDVAHDAEDHHDEAAKILLASEHLPRSMRLRFRWLSPLSPERRGQLADRYVLIREPGDVEE